jgi:hypothetical protein
MVDNFFDKKEDVMSPKPTPEQTQMWDEMEASLDEETITIKSNFHALPDNLKTHIASTETAEAIRTISQKHQLPENQIPQLSYITALILIGEINIVNFVKTLQEKFGLKEEPARQLARDINQKIFLPVKESLKKIHKVPEWPREKETTPDQPVNNEPQLNGNIVDLKNEN